MSFSGRYLIAGSRESWFGSTISTTDTLRTNRRWKLAANLVVWSRALRSTTLYCSITSSSLSDGPRPGMPSQSRERQAASLQRMVGIGAHSLNRDLGDVHTVGIQKSCHGWDSGVMPWLRIRRVWLVAGTLVCMYIVRASPFSLLHTTSIIQAILPYLSSHTCSKLEELENSYISQNLNL